MAATATAATASGAEAGRDAERGSGEAPRQTALAGYGGIQAPAGQPGGCCARLHLLDDPQSARAGHFAWAAALLF
jgi:hypothetical protein